MLKNVVLDNIKPKVVSLRPFQPGDWDFSYVVYASTRMEEMALVDWTDEQKSTFLSMQFNAQRMHYEKYYPQSEYKIIQLDTQPIGRLIVDRSKNPTLLIDIALLPEYRNQGIGTGFIKDLMAEVVHSHQSLTLHVEIFNRALKLYERLGFVKTDEKGIYYEMQWPAKTEAK